MRDRFPEHYRLTDAELDAIWDEGTLGVDTNVLLNQLRAPKNARVAMDSVFDHFKDRVWLPYQVGYEFQLNWRDAQKPITSIKAEIEGVKNKLLNVVQQSRRFGIWPDYFSQQVDEFFNQASAILDTASGDLPVSSDERESLGQRFVGRIGGQPDNIVDRHKTAEKRRKDKVPPGFKDERNGDFLLWSELLDHAKAKSCHIIFATDDVKEDWWEASDRFHPSLRLEFAAETGKLIWAMTSAELIKVHGLRTGKPVPEATIEAISEARVPEREPQLIASNEWYQGVNAIAHIVGWSPAKVESVLSNLWAAAAEMDETIDPERLADLQYTTDEAKYVVQMWRDHLSSFERVVFDKTLASTETMFSIAKMNSTRKRGRSF